MAIGGSSLEDMVNPNPEFWRDKKVLVTGHTGFKGSWLSVWLGRLGARVTGYALEPPSNPAMFDALNLSSQMESIHGDVRDLDHLGRVIREGQFDLIVHMAAQSLVRESYDAPVETYATNVMGTVHVLEAARASETVRVVVNVTSDKCYENPETDCAFVETDPMGGFDPYSNSKGCAELVTAAYSRSFFGPGKGLGSVRAGNVIGGGDWAKDRLIPDIMRGFLGGETVLIRSPQGVRPWQHVLEPLSGYLVLAERMWDDTVGYAGGWNFGPLESDTKPVSWIVECLADAWGEGANWVVDQGDHPHEAKNLRLDIGKAQSQLQYQPRLTLADALKWVVEWYRAFGAGEHLMATTEQQIQRFEQYGI